MKKIVFLSLMIFGFIVTNNEEVEASAYVGNTDEIQIDHDANKEAIRILKNNGDIENAPVSLDKLTTETPVQSLNISRMSRAALQMYTTNEGKNIYGIYQFRCNKLAPVGFNWYQNGIPAYATQQVSASRFVFKTANVWDTGVGAYDKGYYWRNFGTPWGSFWASVWNLNDLFY